MSQLSTDELQVVDAARYSPSVSLILSFEPLISLQSELQHSLKFAADKAKKELQEVYPEHTWMPVYQKLEAAIQSLDYESAKKSVAIFVSPVLSKQFYLDVPVENKIVIDESFEVRDLVYAKQQSSKFIVLVLSGSRAKAFLGDAERLMELKLAHPRNIEAYESDAAERVANFSDPSSQKEALEEKFIRGVDDSLGELLKVNALPVILVGVERMLGHFKSISRHADAVVADIYGNHEDTPVPGLIKLIAPYAERFRKQHNDAALSKIDAAMSAKRLRFGVKEVWTAANRNEGHLLFVEKNFQYPAEHTGDKFHIRHHDDQPAFPFYIKDAVDDIIEVVIQNGGEVFFVDDGVLADYLRIALITYY